MFGKAPLLAVATDREPRSYDEGRLKVPAWFKKRWFSGDMRASGLQARHDMGVVISLDLVCAAPYVAGANQSANQAQTKAQIKFPMTSGLLLAITFGGANHRANQIGSHSRLDRPGCHSARSARYTHPSFHLQLNRAANLAFLGLQVKRRYRLVDETCFTSDQVWIALSWFSAVNGFP